MFYGGQAQRPDSGLDLDLGPQRAFAGHNRRIGQVVDRVFARIAGVALGWIVRIKLKSRLQKGAGDPVAQLAKFGAQARCVRYDPQVDVFRHAPDETMRPAQSRAAAKHQTEGFHIGGVDRRQGLDYIPVLLDQGRAWQFKTRLDFEQILERGLSGQAPTPAGRHADGARNDP